MHVLQTIKNGRSIHFGAQNSLHVFIPFVLNIYTLGLSYRGEWPSDSLMSKKRKMPTTAVLQYVYLGIVSSKQLPTCVKFAQYLGSCGRKRLS